MRTSNNTYTLIQLEHLFAEDFSSPIFPILANYYFNCSKFNKALKVCQIGLEHNPNNLAGKYILAKTHIMENNIFKAEKLLKQIVSLDQCNIEALIALIKIELSLKRSNKIINQYLLLAITRIPNNKKIRTLYNQRCKKNNIETEDNTKEIINQTRNSKSIKFTKQVATKTMYNILVKQKKYNEATQILEFMIKIKKNPTFATKEHKKMLKLKKKQREQL